MYKYTYIYICYIHLYVTVLLSKVTNQILTETCDMILIVEDRFWINIVNQCTIDYGDIYMAIKMHNVINSWIIDIINKIKIIKKLWYISGYYNICYWDLTRVYK